VACPNGPKGPQAGRREGGTAPSESGVWRSLAVLWRSDM